VTGNGAAAGPVLGAILEWQGPPVSVRLHPGDILALYTDGLTEARRGRRGTEYFGTEGVASALKKAKETSAPSGALAAIAGEVAETAKAFAGGSLRDDTCLLLARYVPASPTQGA
jgi:serine phosphatase RsbU (regulator of sigma subunit)